VSIEDNVLLEISLAGIGAKVVFVVAVNLFIRREKTKEKNHQKISY
jgi:hypothetical protein